jgi:hypothetical protein
MRTVPPENRSPRKASIRIHTMLNRVKMYEATDWWIYDNCLSVIGTNIESNHEGRFYFPLCSIEHFNIDEN